MLKTFLGRGGPRVVVLKLSDGVVGGEGVGGIKKMLLFNYDI